MKTVARSHAEHELTQLAAQFDHWRQHRTTRAQRIPQALWEQAVALTAVLPLSRVAKCLRVSWRDLHQHCVTYHPAPVGETAPAALGFVEMPTTPAWSMPPSHTEIELQRADGTRLRIHSQASQLPLVAVVRTFLEPL
jgi:hypothetical protein